MRPTVNSLLPPFPLTDQFWPLLWKEPEGVTLGTQQSWEGSLLFSMQQTWHSSLSSFASELAHVHSSKPYFSQMEPEHCCGGKSNPNKQCIPQLCSWFMQRHFRGPCYLSHNKEVWLLWKVSLRQDPVFGRSTFEHLRSSRG